MAKITNEAGTEICFKAAMVLMDDDIRDHLSDKMAPCTEIEFFLAYCAAHRQKFAEEFEPNKRSPAW